MLSTIHSSNNVLINIVTHPSDALLKKNNKSLRRLLPGLVIFSKGYIPFFSKGVIHSLVSLMRKTKGTRIHKGISACFP